MLLAASRTLIYFEKKICPPPRFIIIIIFNNPRAGECECILERREMRDGGPAWRPRAMCLASADRVPSRGRRWNRRVESWTGSGPGGRPVGRAQQGSLCQEGERAEWLRKDPPVPSGLGRAMTVGLGPGVCSETAQACCSSGSVRAGRSRRPSAWGGEDRLVSATVPAGPAQRSPSPSAFPVPGGFWRASKAQGHWRNDQFSILFPNYSAD